MRYSRGAELQAKVDVIINRKEALRKTLDELDVMYQDCMRGARDVPNSDDLIARMRRNHRTLRDMRGGLARLYPLEIPVQPEPEPEPEPEPKPKSESESKGHM